LSELVLAGRPVHAAVADRGDVLRGEVIADDFDGTLFARRLDRLRRPERAACGCIDRDEIRSRGDEILRCVESGAGRILSLDAFIDGRELAALEAFDEAPSALLGPGAVNWLTMMPTLPALSPTALRSSAAAFRPAVT
jgi:hypothetical protein